MLRTVRMLSLPTIDYGKPTNPTTWNDISITDDDVCLTQMIMHKFATRIMQYLWSRGSGIKTFGASPDIMIHKERPKSPDENGHVWPRYLYTRGRLSDAKGLERAVVVPTPFDDDNWQPQYTVMDYRFE